MAAVARDPNQFLAAVQSGVTVAGFFFSAAYGVSMLAPDFAPMEDIIEELVGEIRDEYDPVEPVLVRAAGGAVTVNAGLTMQLRYSRGAQARSTFSIALPRATSSTSLSR